MTKEIYYLLSLCRAHLEEKKLSLDENINYEKLFSLSLSHNLSALVYCVINTSENKEVVPEETFAKFQNTFFEAVMRYEAQSGLIKEIDALLTKNKIRHVFFKGAWIRDYYPVPEVRVMGDIDLLFSVNDRDSVRDIFVKNGFKLVNSNGPVFDYEKDGYKIEAHTKLFGAKIGTADVEKVSDRAFDYTEFDNYRGKFDVNFHFAYLIAHLAHHFWFYGAGIRLVYDLAVVQKNFKLDYEKVFSLLDEMGLERFGKVILSVCKKWFGTGEDYVENTEDTEKFLLSYGVFGNSNRNRSAVIERKELEEGKSTSPVMTRLRLLFPPYRKLKDIPYIKFIDGRPYLTPLAWAYRIYYNFRYRKDFVKNATGKIGSDESKKEAERELDYFKEIGLWQH